MAEKELRKMSRAELIEIIYALQQDEKAIRIQNNELANRLEDRTLRIENAGSIAEAALSLNRVFEDAQRAADQYLDSILSIGKGVDALMRTSGKVEEYGQRDSPSHELVQDELCAAGVFSKPQKMLPSMKKEHPGSSENPVSAERMRCISEEAFRLKEKELREAEEKCRSAEAALQETEERLRIGREQYRQIQAESAAIQELAKKRAFEQLQQAREQSDALLRQAQNSADEQLRQAQNSADEQLRQAQKRAGEILRKAEADSTRIRDQAQKELAVSTGQFWKDVEMVLRKYPELAARLYEERPYHRKTCEERPNQGVRVNECKGFHV